MKRLLPAFAFLFAAALFAMPGVMALAADTPVAPQSQSNEQEPPPDLPEPVNSDAPQG